MHYLFLILIFFLFFERLFQTLIFLFCETHEAAVLRTSYTFDVDWIVEVLQIFVGLTDTVVLRAVGVLNVCYSPAFFADNLEST